MDGVNVKTTHGSCVQGKRLKDHQMDEEEAISNEYQQYLNKQYTNNGFMQG
jgi:hypothetical protein